MRLVLQLGGRFVSVSWIKRRRSGIIGWFSSRRIEYSFAPRSQQERVDVHFRYPTDGNIHFSFKYYGAERRLIRVESYYFDRVRTKTFRDGVARTSEIPRSKWELKNDRIYLLPVYRPASLSEYTSAPIVYQLPLTGFNVFPGQQPLIFKGEETLTRSTDLIIPIDRPHPTNVSFSASLLGKGANIQFGKVEPRDEYFQMQDDLGYPIIQLSILLTPIS
jgi:hypothetical protein